MDIEEREKVIRDYIKHKKFMELRGYLESLELEEIKEILLKLNPEERSLVFRLLSKEKASKLFESLGEDVRSNIIEKMKDVAKIFEDMDVSELAEIFDELPPSVAIELIRTIPKEERQLLLRIMGHEEGKAARLITHDFIRIGKGETVAKALKLVRRMAKETENISLLYVVDEAGNFLGVVELRDLLRSSPNKRIKSIMKPYPVANAGEDQEEVVRKLLDYDITEIPVVDSEGKLIGIITAEDAMEVINEEATEDIELLGGVSAGEDSYFLSNVRERVLSRLPWLVVLLLAAFSSATIISIYRESLERAIILAAFIPMILGTGGNTGSQVVALVVRALALGELTPKNALSILAEELKTVISLATILAFIGFVISFVEAKVAVISFIVSLSIFSVVIAANFIAFAFPFFLKKLNIDPAVASGPLVSTLMDSVGLLIFFNTANIVLSAFGV